MNDPYDSYITDTEPPKPKKKRVTKDNKKEPVSTWFLLIFLLLKLAVIGCIIGEATR